MRSIGVKNKNMVKRLTVEEFRKDSNQDVEQAVIDRLSVDLWDIWESADDEIRRIITDTIFEQIY